MRFFDLTDTSNSCARAGGPVRTSTAHSAATREMNLLNLHHPDSLLLRFVRHQALHHVPHLVDHAVYDVMGFNPHLARWAETEGVCV